MQQQDVTNQTVSPYSAEHWMPPDVQPRGDIHYPFAAKPAGADVIEIVDGIFWARIPLPWALDHINVYLLRDEGRGWTLIDTGAQGRRGKAAWETLFKDFLGDEEITRVIATHMHPDHLGLAGWLCRRTQADFYISEAEYLTANLLWQSASDTVPDTDIEFLFRAGVSPALEDMIRAFGYQTYKKGVSPLPGQYIRLEDGQTLTMAGRRWQVIIGRGHSPEHACFYCLDEPLLISGDQILPTISSNVSVFAREPYGNPLGYWMTSLQRFLMIPGDPLVLPSHGRVFVGLHTRAKAMQDEHVTRLADLHKKLTGQTASAVEAIPFLFGRSLKGFEFIMGLGEAIAHIHLLEALGLMERMSGDRVHRFAALDSFPAETILSLIQNLPGLALPDIKIRNQ